MAASLSTGIGLFSKATCVESDEGIIENSVRSLKDL